MTTLLEDITSGDSHRVWSSSCAIIKLRDADELDELAARITEIEKKTRDLALGGALFPNAEHLRFAIRKLKYHRDRAGCLCRLYPEYLMYDPKREEDAGNVRIESATSSDGGWSGAYVCRCAVCGSRYEVEEQLGYHYPWWGWKSLTSSDVGLNG